MVERRGFLKQLVAAGSALILPNQEQKLILPESLVEPESVGTVEVLDLDDYILVPKSAIKNWDQKPTVEKLHMNFIIQNADALTRVAAGSVANLEATEVNISASFLSRSKQLAKLQVDLAKLQIGRLRQQMQMIEKKMVDGEWITASFSGVDPK